MKPNGVINPDFMPVLYSKALTEYKKSKFTIGDCAVRISKFDLPFRKGYKAQFKQKFYDILAIATQKPPTYSIKDEKKKSNVGNFTSRKRLVSIDYGFVYNRVGFQRIIATLSKQYAQFFYKLINGVGEFGGTMGGSILPDFLPIKVPKRYRGQVYVF